MSDNPFMILSLAAFLLASGSCSIFRGTVNSNPSALNIQWELVATVTSSGVVSNAIITYPNISLSSSIYFTTNYQQFNLTNFNGTTTSSYTTYYPLRENTSLGEWIYPMQTNIVIGLTMVPFSGYVSIDYILNGINFDITNYSFTGTNYELTTNIYWVGGNSGYTDFHYTNI